MLAFQSKKRVNISKQQSASEEPRNEISGPEIDESDPVKGQKLDNKFQFSNLFINLSS